MSSSIQHQLADVTDDHVDMEANQSLSGNLSVKSVDLSDQESLKRTATVVTSDRDHSQTERERLQLKGYMFKKTESELPPTMYSAMLVGPAVEFGDDECANRCLDAEIILLGLVNIMIQFCGIFFVYKMYKTVLQDDEALVEREGGVTCAKNAQVKEARWFAVLFWSFSLMQDFFETHALKLWLSYAMGDPLGACWKSLLAKVDDCCCLPFKLGYWFANDNQRTVELIDADGEPVLKEDTENTMNKVLNRLRNTPLLWQIFLNFVCVQVKYLVAICLAFFGTGWLVLTPDIGDLLLNCVALEFLLALSASVYDFFLPHELKKFIETDAPKFRLTYQLKPTNIHRMSGIFKKAFVVFFFAVIMNQIFCPNSMDAAKFDWF